MTKLTQKTTIHMLSGEDTVFYTYHIYTLGVFMADGRKQGWHIESRDPDVDQDYTEDLTVTYEHDIPSSLPDIELWEEEETIDDTDEEATAEDYKAALRMLGVDV